jgi:hypothetical protein
VAKLMAAELLATTIMRRIEHQPRPASPLTQEIAGRLDRLNGIFGCA